MWADPQAILPGILCRGFPQILSVFCRGQSVSLVIFVVCLFSVLQVKLGGGVDVVECV